MAAAIKVISIDDPIKFANEIIDSAPIGDFNEFDELKKALKWVVDLEELPQMSFDLYNHLLDLREAYIDPKKFVNPQEIELLDHQQIERIQHIFLRTISSHIKRIDRMTLGQQLLIVQRTEKQRSEEIEEIIVP